MTRRSHFNQDTHIWSSRLILYSIGHIYWYPVISIPSPTQTLVQNCRLDSHLGSKSAGQRTLLGLACICCQHLWLMTLVEMTSFHTFQCRPKQSKHDKKRYPHLCHWCGRINHGLLEGRGCCGSWATLSQLLEIWQSASNFGDQPWFPEQIPLHIGCCVYKCLIFSVGIWITLNPCRILWSQVFHNPNSLHGWSPSSTPQQLIHRLNTQATHREAMRRWCHLSHRW